MHFRVRLLVSLLMIQRVWLVSEWTLTSSQTPPCTVGMNYTLELEAGRAAMGPSRRSFFQSTTCLQSTGVLEQSVKVLNDNTSQCQNHTVLICRAVIDRESEFNVSLRAQGKISSVPQSDGNQTLSDLLERPVVIYSPNTELVSVSAAPHMTTIPLHAASAHKHHLMF